MEVGGKSRLAAVGSSSSSSSSYSGDQQELGGMMMAEEEEEEELRRGPWTVEEDFALINYISANGEGRWNSLARSAGLKRTGKSCRLRWLNYLRPDVRRGNITLEEQLLILELHSRWGNRWSKIAQHLPGRTDNEIKNYWRTRVQKHAKQLQCDVNSQQFKDTVRYLWVPRLVEKIQAASTGPTTTSSSLDGSSSSNIPTTTTMQTTSDYYYNSNNKSMLTGQICTDNYNNYDLGNKRVDPIAVANCSTTESFGTQVHASDLNLLNHSNYYNNYYYNDNNTQAKMVEEENYYYYQNNNQPVVSNPDLEPSGGDYLFKNHDDGSGGLDCFHSTAMQMTSDHHYCDYYTAAGGGNDSFFWPNNNNDNDDDQDQDILSLSQLQLNARVFK